MCVRWKKPMRTSTTAITVAGAIMAAAAGSPARADGPYLGAFGGLNYLQTDKVTQSSPFAATFKASHELGFVAGGSVGYRWDSGLRGEGEVAYRQNRFDKTIINGTGFDTSGKVSTVAFMANVFYDHHWGRWVATVGGGIGAAVISVKDFSNFATPAPLSDTITRFAYQGIAGLGYDITPNTRLGVEYRYFATTGTAFSDTAAGATYSFKSDPVRSHSVLATIKYFF